MPCSRCGRIQTDPVKGASPWARGVLDGEQVLVCPECQVTDPDWADRLDTCSHCGSTRLRMVMGIVECRACGHQAGA